MLHFYFHLSISELNELDIDEWIEKYNQLIYALNFDGKRLSGDKNRPAKLPL